MSYVYKSPRYMLSDGVHEPSYTNFAIYRSPHIVVKHPHNVTKNVYITLTRDEFDGLHAQLKTLYLADDWDALIGAYVATQPKETTNERDLFV